MVAKINENFLVKKCVGAIDGTHMSVRPPANATQAHRSTITTNVLCVCNMDM